MREIEEPLIRFIKIVHHAKNKELLHQAENFSTGRGFPSNPVPFDDYTTYFANWSGQKYDPLMLFLQHQTDTGWELPKWEEPDRPPNESILPASEFYECS